MPARVVMYFLGLGRAPAIEFSVKQVFKEAARTVVFRHHRVAEQSIPLGE